MLHHRKKNNNNKKRISKQNTNEVSFCFKGWPQFKYATLYFVQAFSLLLESMLHILLQRSTILFLFLFSLAFTFGATASTTTTITSTYNSNLFAVIYMNNKSCCWKYPRFYRYSSYPHIYKHTYICTYIHMHILRLLNKSSNLSRDN